MSLRATVALLGRWNSRDFMKGRGKMAGAVHTRHTHGSKGRYPRLSSHYGLRDGRRHVQNHMRGGLGIKLGGGLFGLRIPRQHRLSSMTPEEYDVQLYGHPNITNPYREHLELHPTLRLVMHNARLDVDTIVLLPRVSRRYRGDGGVPAAWRRTLATVLEDAARHDWGWEDSSPPSSSSSPPSVAATAASGKPRARLVLCTLHHHVALPLDECLEAKGSGAPSQAVISAMKGLYEAHSKGRVLHQQSPPQQRHRVGTFYAGAVGSGDSARRMAALLPSPWASESKERDKNAQQPQQHQQQQQQQVTGTETHADASASGGVAAEGVEEIFEKLNGPHTLCVCCRMQPASPDSSPSPTPETAAAASSEEKAVRSDDDAAEVDSAGEGSGATLRELRQAIRQSQAARRKGRGGHVFTVPHNDTPSLSAHHQRQQQQQPLLKSEVDAEEFEGVWGQPRSRVSELLRWHYARDDPRAHHADALPHENRRLRVLLLLDASKTAPASEYPRGQARPQSLMSSRFSERLKKVGCLPLEEATLDAVLGGMGEWAVERQWADRPYAGPQAPLLMNAAASS